MLQVQRITRMYGTHKAVDNVGFSIHRGEIVGLLGENGAGKTTILKMISGFIEPDKGQIHVQHLDITQHTKKVQNQIGYLPENLPIYPEMLVADYLDFAAELKGIPSQNKAAEIKRVIKAVEIENKITQPIFSLSRGYKQRVGVAQAILGRPKLLLLDEPTNGLDPEQTKLMRALIANLAKEATVILSTHIMQEVDAMCSRVLMLSKGKLVVDEYLSDLKKTQYILLETSYPEAKMNTFLSIEGVLKVEVVKSQPYSERYSYRIHIVPTEEEREILSALARFVIEQHQHLYVLHPVRQDLEHLFQRSNQLDAAKEVHHA